MKSSSVDLCKKDQDIERTMKTKLCLSDVASQVLSIRSAWIAQLHYAILTVGKENFPYTNDNYVYLNRQIWGMIFRSSMIVLYHAH